MPRSNKTAAKPVLRSAEAMDNIISDLVDDNEVVTSVATRIIKDNPWQPRRHLDSNSMNDLIENVKLNGIIQPLLLNLRDNQYFLIAGQRRLAAARHLGFANVPARVFEVSDEEARVISVTENLSREDLNPIDETDAVLGLLALRLGTDTEGVRSILERLDRITRSVNVSNDIDSEPHMDAQVKAELSERDAEYLQVVQQTFTRLGRYTWRSFIKSRLPLLRLPDDVVGAIRGGTLQYTKGLEIGRIQDNAQRQALLKRTIEEGLSFKNVQAAVRDALKRNQKKTLSPIDDLKKRLTSRRIAKLPEDKKIRVNELLMELKKLVG